VNNIFLRDAMTSQNSPKSTIEFNVEYNIKSEVENVDIVFNSNRRVSLSTGYLLERSSSSLDNTNNMTDESRPSTPPIIPDEQDSDIDSYDPRRKCNYSDTSDFSSQPVNFVFPLKRNASSDQEKRGMDMKEKRVRVGVEVDDGTKDKRVHLTENSDIYENDLYSYRIPVKFDQIDRRHPAILQTKEGHAEVSPCVSPIWGSERKKVPIIDAFELAPPSLDHGRQGATGERPVVTPEHCGIVIQNSKRRKSTIIGASLSVPSSPTLSPCVSPTWGSERKKAPIIDAFELSPPSLDYRKVSWDNLTLAFKKFTDRGAIEERPVVTPEPCGIMKQNAMQRSSTIIGASLSVPSSPTCNRVLGSLPPSLFFTSPRKVLQDFSHVPLPPLTPNDVIEKASEQTYQALHRGKDQIGSYVRQVTRNAETKGLLVKPLQLKLRRRFVGIPSDHRYKFYWDVITIILTYVSAYTMHLSVRDRTYEFTAIDVFTRIWFGIDVLLNFILVEQNPDGEVVQRKTARSAKYLMTWFPIDVLSIYPWERMLLQPIIEQQNRRNLATKWFFRSKATVKVTRFLKGRHFKFFGRVANSTKRIGVGGKKLLALIIKYVPKYLLFYRNMKAVILLKILRQIHFIKKMYVSTTSDPLDDESTQADTDSSIDGDERSCELDNSNTNMKFFIYEDDSRVEILLDEMSKLKTC